jgi:hypothetical protein
LELLQQTVKTHRRLRDELSPLLPL